MAATYRPPEVVERERALADLLARREGLSPPVDIRALVEQRADITEERIPAKCDAVMYRPTIAATRPQVILQASPNSQRQRFTLAHELGHLLLPWHLGTVACHVDTHDLEGEYTHALAESEANRFAAELLVPTGWLAALLDKSPELPDAFEHLYSADVSAHVACLQLTRVLAPGWVFAIHDDDDHVVLGGASRDTAVRPPVVGSRAAPSFAKFCDSEYVLPYGYRVVTWWHYAATARDELLEADDSRTSSEILRDLAARHAETNAEAQSLARSINGATGYAYGIVRNENLSDAELLAHLRSRFAGRSLPDDLLDDPDIEAYLLKRVRELRER